jgi:hypothetical protein
MENKNKETYVNFRNKKVLVNQQLDFKPQIIKVYKSIDAGNQVVKKDT